MKTERPEDIEFERQLPVAAILDEYLACSGRRPITAWIGSRQDPPAPRGMFRASGGGCLRRDILRWDGQHGDPIAGISLRRFAVGNLIEFVLEEAFRWKGVLLASQERVWCDWALRPGMGHREDWMGRTVKQGPRLDLSGCLVAGTLDAVVTWSPHWAEIVGPVPADERALGGRVFCVDWKSCHETKLSYLDDELVDAAYQDQLATYAWLAMEQLHYPIEQARLIYVGKDTMRVKQVGIPLIQSIEAAKDGLRRKRDSAEARARSGAIPPEIPLRDGKPEWKCDPRYCEFALTDHCPTIKAYWTKLVTDQETRKASGAAPATVRRVNTADEKAAKEHTNGVS